jgi:hypothetical protein
MQFLGMAGHFGLGNTNSIASLDVARAYIVSLTKTFSSAFFPFPSYLTNEF